VIVFAAIFAIVQWRHVPVNNGSGLTGIPKPVSPVPSSKESLAAVTPSPKDKEQTANAFVPKQPKRAIPERRVVSNELAARQVKLLPGERSYLKQIASLDTTIKSENSRPMRPGLQAEYERNLALVDRAIAATRSAAKSNPNDPDAAEFMFAAYQSKLDLLNQVADARLSNRPR
jgi:hypothetical protein